MVAGGLTGTFVGIMVANQSRHAELEYSIFPPYGSYQNLQLIKDNALMP